MIYATSDFMPDVLPAFIARLAIPGVRWTQRIYHLIPPDRVVPFIAQRVSHTMIRLAADGVIVDNELLRRELSRRKYGGSFLAVNYPGIDVAFIRGIRSPGSQPYDGVYLGRLHRSKGLFELLEIWRLVCKSLPGAQLAIIGRADAGFQRELARRIDQSGMANNVRLFGFVEASTAVRLMKSSKVFLSASGEEGFGMAVLEAMASGLPVVAWDLPVYAEAFPGGMIRITRGDIEEFAKSVVRLLLDETFRGQIADVAWAIPERYDWSVVAACEKILLDQSSERGRLPWQR